MKKLLFILTLVLAALLPVELWAQGTTGGDDGSDAVAAPTFRFDGDYLVIETVTEDASIFYQMANLPDMSDETIEKIISSMTVTPDVSQSMYYEQPILLQNRIIIVRDGFRSLLPLPHDEFIERPALESIEERSEQMPLYMAEQMQIDNNYYYSIKTPIEDYKKLDVFLLQIPLQRIAGDNDIEVIDTVSDPHGIDIFINHCLSENDFKKKVIVKAFKKQPMNDLVMSMLEKMNWLLGQFGGEVYELDESAIDEGFHPSEETKSLLAESNSPP